VKRRIGAKNHGTSQKCAVINFMYKLWTVDRRLFSAFQQNEVRVFEPFDEGLEEARCLGPIDDPMIE